MPAARPSLTLDDAVDHCREHDLADPGPRLRPHHGRHRARVPHRRPPGGRIALAQAERIVADLSPLPAGSRLTIEPGGQLEISAPPRSRTSTTRCTATANDLFVLDQRCAADGVELVALGADPVRVARARRHRAALSRDGGLLRHTRSRRAHDDVQHRGAPGERRPRRRSHGRPLAPRATTSARPSSPASPTRPSPTAGPSGWQSTRLQAVVGCSTRPARRRCRSTSDPVGRWPAYALDAQVMLIRRSERRPPRRHRRPDVRRVDLATATSSASRRIDDLVYHLTTLFPPVRPKGWLELRMFDALPTPFWQVADGASPSAAARRRAGRRRRRPRRRRHRRDLWVDAAQLGLGHPALRRVGTPMLRARASRPSSATTPTPATSTS